MECSEVGSLLSEFIDDALDPTARRLVEEHIARCSACAAELEALRACARAVGSLERMSAPANFLAGVHEHIVRPSLWRRIAGSLPPLPRFKIPLELTGLVTAGLLVVAIYYAMQSGRDAAFIPPAAPPPSAPSPAPPPLPGPPSSPGAPPALSLSRSTIELTLVTPSPQPLRERELERATMPRAMRDSTAPLTNKAKKEVPLPAAPAPAQPKGSASVSRAPEPDQTTSVRDQTVSETIARIRQIVENAGGSMQKADFSEEEGGNVQSLDARVPSRSYSLILNELRSLGELREPPVGPDAAAGYGDDEPVLLCIRIISPQ